MQPLPTRPPTLPLVLRALTNMCLLYPVLSFLWGGGPCPGGVDSPVAAGNASSLLPAAASHEPCGTTSYSGARTVQPTPASPFEIGGSGRAKAETA